MFKLRQFFKSPQCFVASAGVRQEERVEIGEILDATKTFIGDIRQNHTEVIEILKRGHLRRRNTIITSGRITERQ